VDRVYLPGEREWLLSEERRRSGLPIARTTLAALDAVAREVRADVDFGALAAD
jgi:LDH2 family malate/lactate/ureidoglycolate dehydrogenase